MGGWGSFLDRVTGWLPILTPAQRRRAKIAKIKQEIKELQSKPWSVSNSALMYRYQRELDQLQNEASNQ